MIKAGEIEELERELVSVLEVAIARGEKLDYLDDDYRERLAQLDPEAAARAEEKDDEDNG
jgi:hypothetical protein